MATKGLSRDKKSFILLFSVELWERWAFYGMQALLALYLVTHLGFTDKKAYSLFAAFVALLYIFPSYGGFLCDKFLGAKRTLLIGGIILCSGYGVLAFDATASHIYFPLALIVVGGGIFKPNPSRLISKIYEHNSAQVSSAFTIFYMSINIGSLLSMAVTPIVAKYYSFNAAFAVSFVGMIIALLNYVLQRRLLNHITTKAGRQKVTGEKIYIVTTSVIGSIAISWWLLLHTEIASYAILLGGIAVLLYAFKESLYCTPEERKRLLLAFILIIQAIIFFVFYFQMPTTMTLFALRNVSHYLLGIPVSPASFQLLNSLWILILSPILAWLYMRFGHSDKDVSIPTKFALGTIFSGLGVLSMPLACFFAHNGVINGNWLILSYGLESLGEMLVSALGLAMISLYMPKRMMGFAFGAWFMCSAVAGILTGKLAAYASVPKSITSPIQTMAIYVHYFSWVGIIILAIGIVLLALVPLLMKLDVETAPQIHFQNLPKSDN